MSIRCLYEFISQISLILHVFITHAAYLLVTSDKGGGKYVCPRSFVCVCLSVCLLLLKNAYMDLDEMLHVHRCRDLDELINFLAGSGL